MDTSLMIPPSPPVLERGTTHTTLKQLQLEMDCSDMPVEVGGEELLTKRT